MIATAHPTKTIVKNGAAAKGQGFQFDRKAFFDQYRDQFGRIKRSKQVANIEMLLNFVEGDKGLTSVKQIAYVLATVKHETAHSFEPKRERYNGTRAEYFGKKYGPIEKDKKGKVISGHKDAAKMGHETNADGANYYGRGYVQITWKENYKTMEKKCSIANLAKKPDLALDPKNAYCILSKGMQEGLFRPGHKLSTYVSDDKADYKNARNVVNAKLDKADTIEGYAEKFEAILEAASDESGDAPATPKSTPLP